jgi:hypothetical protein
LQTTGSVKTAQFGHWGSENHNREDVNKWTWLCSHKTLQKQVVSWNWPTSYSLFTGVEINVSWKKMDTKIYLPWFYLCKLQVAGKTDGKLLYLGFEIILTNKEWGLPCEGHDGDASGSGGLGLRRLLRNFWDDNNVLFLDLATSYRYLWTSCLMHSLWLLFTPYLKKETVKTKMTSGRWGSLSQKMAKWLSWDGASQLGTVLPPKGHLPVSGDICCYHDWEYITGM